MVVPDRQSLDYGSGQVGVPTTLVRGKSPSNQSPVQFQVSGRPRSMFGHPVRNLLPATETSCRGGHRSPFPGLLRKTFRCSKSLRGMATGVGSVTSEHFSSENKVQDGDACIRQRGTSSFGLGDLHRSDGCLFPHSDTQVRSEMVAFPVGRPGVPIQGAAVRAFSSALDFHHGGAAVLRTSASAGHSSQSLSRRLVDLESTGITLPTAHPGSPATSTGARLFSQPREVRVDSLSKVHLPGHGVRHPSLDRVSRSAENRQTARDDPVSVRSPFRTSQGSGIDFRPNGIDVYPHSVGQSLQTPVPGVVELGMGARSSRVEHFSPTSRLVPGVNETMAGHVLAYSGCPHFSPSPRDASVFGRVSPGLGGPSGWTHSVGPLDPDTEIVSHQHSRIRGSLSGPSQIRLFSSGQTCVDPHGQHYCGSLPEQARRHSIASPVQQGVRDHFLVFPAENCDLRKVSARSFECSGRLSQSVITNPPHGVDNLPPGTPAPLGSGGETFHRPVCHTVLAPSADVCVSVSRPGGMADQCHGDRLEGDESLRLSSLSALKQGHEESRLRAALPHTNSTFLAEPAMVPGSPAPRQRPSHSSGSQKRRASTAENRGSTQGSSDPCPARLDTVRRSLRRSGASDLTLDLVQKAHRSSTTSVYTSHWASWAQWCRLNGVNPVSPRSMEVANHLAWLSSQGRSASTLRVRRSAISVTLKQLGRSISLGGVIASVIKGSALSSAASRTSVPAWDLLLVLEFLRSRTFEPLRDASLPNLTRKALMLVLLASARRGSEVHALSGRAQDITFERDGSITLQFCSSFVAKNQKPDQPSPVISIQPLSSILPSGDPDLANCPVRVLRTYLSRTAPVRDPSQKLLFISLNTSRSKDIAKTTLARWSSTLIKQAYQWWQTEGGGRSVLPLRSPRTHEARAWAASLAVLRSGRIADVLRAAYWASEDVFLNFYLRDISSTRQDGNSGLPAMVAAGQILTRI